MKTTIEVNGYTILIEEMEGTVQVSALLDEEVVEEEKVSIPVEFI